MRSLRPGRMIAALEDATPPDRPAVSPIETLLRSLNTAEEAAKAPGAVQQKNRTLALPPARDRWTHDAAARTTRSLTAGGALFCLTAPKTSQTPMVCSTTEGSCPAVSAAGKARPIATRGSPAPGCTRQPRVSDAVRTTASPKRPGTAVAPSACFGQPRSVANHRERAQRVAVAVAPRDRPLAARAALCDADHAITSDRSLRRAIR